MSEDAEKPDRLARVRPPALDGAVCFRVFPMTESDPQEVGELHVVIDEEQVSLWFTGASKEKWTGTWTELRWMLRSIRDRATAERIERVRRERAQSEARDMQQARTAWNARKARRKPDGGGK